jgi:hypothetical protein
LRVQKPIFGRYNRTQLGKFARLVKTVSLCKGVFTLTTKLVFLGVSFCYVGGKDEKSIKEGKTVIKYINYTRRPILPQNNDFL